MREFSGEKNKAATLAHSHKEAKTKSNLRRAITSSAKKIKGLFRRHGDKAQVTSELATVQEEDLCSTIGGNTKTLTVQFDHHNNRPQTSELKQQLEDETLPIYIALYNYDARTTEDLSFQKGNIVL